MSHLKKLRSIAWTLGSGVCRQSRHFSHLFVVKLECLKRTKMKEKEAEGGPFNITILGTQGTYSILKNVHSWAVVVVKWSSCSPSTPEFDSR